ncbi:MAG: NUDIX hydrolase [Candidatus Pristimantibacillus lignocellulolyticus]|uniref:NUDIX hydrolase n=1 Tax=Candidatus Pristimantibacillus lignocellulolyticus TaxID=2994561 RepID=A0A9J6ZL73_9BACL|nr:MAG: NUDIX hydrolase [Candidatus Pristimantibacillus lignocellulolyticus]
MLRKIVNILPQSFLVYLYTHIPFAKLKNWLVYRAQHKFLVAVLGVITNERGQVLLLNHVYRTKPWGIPGGWMELESPELGLAREIYEETKLKVNITGLAKAIYGKIPNRIELVYKGTISEGEFEPSAEISNMMYCNVGEWPEGLPDHQKILIKEVLT